MGPPVVHRVYQVLSCCEKPQERLVVLSLISSTGCLPVELHHISLSGEDDNVDNTALLRRGYQPLYPLTVTQSVFDYADRLLGLTEYHFDQREESKV